jgi:hypothetical protein
MKSSLLQWLVDSETETPAHGHNQTGDEEILHKLPANRGGLVLATTPGNATTSRDARVNG